KVLVQLRRRGRGFWVPRFFAFFAKGWARRRKRDSYERTASSLSLLYNPSMDHHTVAAVSIAGTCLDVLGTLYLAYDLLGGQHGPLRLLTRMVTYSIVFGVGY